MPSYLQPVALSNRIDGILDPENPRSSELITDWVERGAWQTLERCGVRVINLPQDLFSCDATGDAQIAIEALRAIFNWEKPDEAA